MKNNKLTKIIYIFILITLFSFNVNAESDDARLKLLSVAGKKIELANNVYEYKLIVDNDVEDLNLIYAPFEATSDVTVIGSEILKEGQNVVYIKVTSINGDTNTYTLTINKKEKQVSSNSKIKELKIDSVNLNFDPDSTLYKIKINNNIDSLKFNIKLYDRKARYEIVGNEELKDGDEILIKVTAEDNTQTTYSIFIAKEKDDTILFIILIIVIIVLVEIIIVLLVKLFKSLIKKTS